MDAFLYQPGYEGKYNITSKLNVNGFDLFLQVGKRCYRFNHYDDGTLEIVLINGNECKITAWAGYPSVKLIVPEAKYDPSKDNKSNE